jgi:phage gpG-like protein
MSEIRGEILGAEAVTRRFREAQTGYPQRLRVTVRTLGAELQRKVKMKLSGDVLNVRTGRLRRSINMKFKDNTSTFRSDVGTNVVYARRFEVGGSWSEQVRAYVRTMRQAWGRPTQPFVQSVRSFTRKVNVKQHSFLVSSLDEMRDSIRGRLAAAITGGK